MTSHNNKAPPLLSKYKTYTDWKKLLQIWTDITYLEKKKQGPALVLTLDGKAQEAALELTSDEITADDGIENIVKRLDKIYMKDALAEKYNAIENFESFKRSSNNMKEFLIEFDKRLHKIKNYITYPDDLLAYRLLKATNLYETHEKLIRATISDLKYDEVHSKLVKVFSKDSVDTSFTSLPIKSESSLYAKTSNEEGHSSQDSDEEENTYYVKKQGRFFKKYKLG